MSEQSFTWNLTPTERRIAETAFARSNIDFDPLARAYDAAMAVRSLRGDVRDRKVSLMERDKMLAELRSEPAHPCDEHDTLAQSVDLFWAVADAAKYDGERNATALSAWFARCHARHARDNEAIGRLRALLERAVSHAIDDDWLKTAREELKEAIAR